MKNTDMKTIVIFVVVTAIFAGIFYSNVFDSNNGRTLTGIAYIVTLFGSLFIALALIPHNKKMARRKARLANLATA